MTDGVHEQWTSKMTISAIPSRSKLSSAKGRSLGWAAFDLKQRGKQGREPESYIDPYPPIQSTSTDVPLPESSAVSSNPSVRSFSSVVQPSIDFPVHWGTGNHSPTQTIGGHSSRNFGNEAEIGNHVNPVIAKLKDLYCWADEGLIEDILGAVNNDFDQASTLLKSMVLSRSSEETKNHGAQRADFEKTTQAVKGARINDVTNIADLKSALDECVFETWNEMTVEDVRTDSKLYDSTAQLISRRVIAAPVEPEWEEDDAYLSHRKDAIRAIRLASQHSRAASNAFMRGDHFSAQKLSMQAREEWNAAEKMNMKAAEEILRIRNSKNGVWKLDLHGLHASEAVHFLQGHLWNIEMQIPLNRSVSPNRSLKPTSGDIHSPSEAITCLGTNMADKERGISWHRPRALQVVTGTGNHSRGQATLPMAVKGFLVENGYRFDEARPGVIDVRPKYRYKPTHEF